jgi:hypothetical protein
MMSVQDNGVGIDEETLRNGKQSHYGLTGMRERAVRIGENSRSQDRKAERRYPYSFLQISSTDPTPSRQILTEKASQN